MRNLVKKFTVICIIAIISFLMVDIAYADKIRVNDSLNLLSTEDKQSLEKTITTIKEKYNMDIVIVTANDLEGKTQQAFADDYYDYNGYGFDSEKSGALLLIDMQSRQVYISTTGKAINYLSDSRINSILDNIYKDLGDGEYYKACNKFLKDFIKYMPKSTSEKVVTSLPIAVVCGLVAAILSCCVVTFSYKKPKTQSGGNYVKGDSLKFTKSRDTFVNTYTTRVKIERNDNNGSAGGGSTTHTSSSGTSHGGGGRGF